MTYRDDRNLNREINQTRRADAGRRTGSIILASLAALAVVFGIPVQGKPF